MLLLPLFIDEDLEATERLSSFPEATLLVMGGAVWLQTVLSLIRDMLFHLEIFESLGRQNPQIHAILLDRSFSTWALLTF